MIKTSQTHPIQIATCRTGFGGDVGLSFCPGKWQKDGMTGEWQRDLGIDVRAIREWGASCVISLIEFQEMDALNVPDLGVVVSSEGMTWLHHPLPDVSAPDDAWISRWKMDRLQVHEWLRNGRRVFVHCKGGLGRAGTLAAMILAEGGMDAAAAVNSVRLARGPGAIETAEQERFVHRWASLLMVNSTGR